MSLAALVLWAVLALVFGWVGWIIWSTLTWLREGFEELERRRQRGGGDDS